MDLRLVSFSCSLMSRHVSFLCQESADYQLQFSIPVFRFEDGPNCRIFARETCKSLITFFMTHCFFWTLSRLRLLNNHQLRRRQLMCIMNYKNCTSQNLIFVSMHNVHILKLDAMSDFYISRVFIFGLFEYEFFKFCFFFIFVIL